MREVAVVTTGFFDGVHLGHRRVLETVVSCARERGQEAIVVTFWPHPRTVLQQDARDFRLLTSLEEKRALLLSAGVDRVEVLPFTRDFAALTAREYVALLRDRFGASLVVMGYDNRIGSDRKTFGELAGVAPCASGAGSPATETPLSVAGTAVLAPSATETPLSVAGTAVLAPSATETALSVAGTAVLASSATETALSVAGTAVLAPSATETPLFVAGTAVLAPSATETALSVAGDDGVAVPISSTRIRRALEAGDIALASGMLGYRYGLHGVVVAGNRMGRTIGFPTANMQLYEPLKLVPANGVYAVEAEVLGRKYRGMTNIGMRPTVGGQVRTIETHILDFAEDIYGLPLQLRFLRRIRDERKFPSLEDLRQQLERDRAVCAEM